MSDKKKMDKREWVKNYSTVSGAVSLRVRLPYLTCNFKMHQRNVNGS